MIIELLKFLICHGIGLVLGIGGGMLFVTTLEKIKENKRK